MSTAARSKDRSDAVLFRLSPENKALLKQRAAEDGFTTLQDWLDAKLLGPHAPKRHQEVLPLTSA